MARNAVQMILRVQELMDRYKSQRHSDESIINCINDAVSSIVKSRIDSIKNPKPYSVQSLQRLRDELYTLIPDADTGAVPGDKVIPYPTGYMYFLLLQIEVNGTMIPCKPTTYNEEGAQALDPFSQPGEEIIFYNEKHDGIRVIVSDTDTIGDYEFWYIEEPDTVSIGNEGRKIVTGGAIANGTLYYVYDVSVYNGTTYYPGETFTGGATATLTSGTVIASTYVTNCNLPNNMHEEVCFKAAEILAGTIDDPNKKQILGVDVANA